MITTIDILDEINYLKSINQDINKLENDINQKRKSKNLWLALSLGSFIVVVFFVTIAKLSDGNSIEGFDHILRPSLIKE